MRTRLETGPAKEWKSPELCESEPLGLRLRTDGAGAVSPLHDFAMSRALKKFAQAPAQAEPAEKSSSSVGRSPTS